MGRLPARLARILTYADLACGASYACLLLLSSPAQADDSGSGLSLLSGATSEDEGAVESVGRLLGDTTRAASDKTTDIVREVGAAVPVAQPVVQPVVDTTTEVVGHTTDAVATEVEHVTAEVDDPGRGGAPPADVRTAAERAAIHAAAAGRGAAGGQPVGRATEG